MLLLATRPKIDLETELYRAAAEAKRQINALFALVQGKRGWELRREKGELILEQVWMGRDANVVLKEDIILRLNELAGKAEIIEPLSADDLERLFEGRPLYNTSGRLRSVL